MCLAQCKHMLGGGLAGRHSQSWLQQRLQQQRQQQQRQRDKLSDILYYYR